MRQTKKIINNVGRDVAEEAFTRYADADATIQKITAEMDIAIIKIREKYQEKLAAAGGIKETNFEILQAYADSNPTDFGKSKSIDFAHGSIGFRTGTPSLKTLKGFTWASVTSLLKEFLPDYVRITEVPAKDALLMDREHPEIAPLFPKCGVVVAQDESFFVQLKKEEVAASI
jgi:phage host-nuclease inhibitor protein Gam